MTENQKKEEFTLLADGKIKYYFESAIEDHTHKDIEESLGSKRHTNEIIFNSKTDAMKIINTDTEEVKKAIEFYGKQMESTAHDLDKFKELESLLLKVSDLNTTVTKLNTTPKQSYDENPKKYAKLWKAFTEARKLITTEIASIANDYDNMQKHATAKKSHDFYIAELEKINEQRVKIEAL